MPLQLDLPSNRATFEDDSEAATSANCDAQTALTTGRLLESIQKAAYI